MFFQDIRVAGVIPLVTIIHLLDTRQVSGIPKAVQTCFLVTKVDLQVQQVIVIHSLAIKAVIATL